MAGERKSCLASTYTRTMSWRSASRHESIQGVASGVDLIHLVNMNNHPTLYSRRTAGDPLCGSPAHSPAVQSTQESAHSPAVPMSRYPLCIAGDAFAVNSNRAESLRPPFSSLQVAIGESEVSRSAGQIGTVGHAKYSKCSLKLRPGRPL